MPAASDRFSLTLETLVPELLGRHPQTRAVLDRYGLRGCGGPDGPHESLRFFARAHGVDERTLMDELRHAVAHSVHAAADRARGEASPRLADAIYRPYFLAGIAVTLTAGAVWGAWLLWKIGVGGDFHAASIHEINAHGHAQIFGWVGLFILGFALQAMPRMWRVELPAPRLAVGACAAMVLGIAVRTVAMASTGAPWAASVALLAGLVELAAILAGVGILLLAWWRCDVKMEPYLGFVLVGLGWFVLQAGAGLWHTWNTMTAATEAELVWYVSTYQAPLRDLQIHGLALFMILGVSIRMLPAMFSLPRIGDRRAWAGLALLTAAVVGEVGCFIAFRWTGNPALAGGLLAAWGLLAAGVAVVALPWKLWRQIATHDRSAKFVRAAYGWLMVSLAMLLLLPGYQWVSGVPFSHAYYGAIRHAVTVGFISLMIMGVSAKVVPTLRGRDPRTLPGLWGPFALINLGCLLRVSAQTLTDWHPAFFAVLGLSGTLEVAALAWWGGHLARLMLTPPEVPPEAPPESAGATPRPARIGADHKVADVLAWFPQTLAVFERFGFTLLGSAAARRTLARRVTLGQAAAFRGVALDSLLEALNDVVQPEGAGIPGALRYDAPLGEVARRLPGAAGVLARHGLDPVGESGVPLGEAADRAGVARELLMAELATAAADGRACTGRCESCEGHHPRPGAPACGGHGAEAPLAAVKEARR